MLRSVFFLSMLSLFLTFALGCRPGILDDTPLSNAYFSREGELLKIYLAEDEQYRLYGHLSRFPRDFLELLLLQEDESFYYHPGVNPLSLTRAFKETYITKSRRIGGSTLTMQTARLKYDLDTSDIPGKIRQIITALYLDFTYSKNEILEAYINLAPCGGNIQGFSAASWIFFGRPLESLTFSELVMLCVIPQDPQGRDPRKEGNREELESSRNRLFDRWVLAHPDDGNTIYHRNLLPEINTDFPFDAPHFTEMVEAEGAVRGEVRTSVDKDIQEMVEKSLVGYRDALKEKGVFNGAALVLDYTTMELLAMVGSADFFDSSIYGMVNGANSRRSPGSTLKPFIYGLALEQGLIHSETVLYDRPVSFSTYAPDNYQRDFKGPVPAWNALVNSRNIPAVELASQLKEPDLYDMLSAAPVGDLKSREYYGLSLVLGSAEFSMLELAGLYAALGNGGELKDIQGGAGIVLQDYHGQILFSPESAFIVRKILERNPAPGEGFILSEDKREELTGPRVAYKTGTSIGFKDAWSIGLYGPYVIAVWIGNFSGEGNPVFLGRETAAPLLFEIAGNLDLPAEEQEYNPKHHSGVQEVEVCSISGCLPSEFCHHTVKAYFIPGVSPIESCEIHRPVIINKETGYRVVREGADTEKVIREIWPSDMLNLFEEAGLPRPVPPPYETSLSEEKLKERHSPPKIVSPVSNAVYILRPESDNQGEIPLTVSADGETEEVFWFVDGVFLERANPKTTIMWKPDVGTHHLILLDDKGMSCDRTVEVVMEVF